MTPEQIKRRKTILTLIVVLLALFAGFLLQSITIGPFITGWFAQSFQSHDCSQGSSIVLHQHESLVAHATTQITLGDTGAVSDRQWLIVENLDTPSIVVPLKSSGRLFCKVVSSSYGAYNLALINASGYNVHWAFLITTADEGERCRSIRNEVWNLDPDCWPMPSEWITS